MSHNSDNEKEQNAWPMGTQALYAKQDGAPVSQIPLDDGGRGMPRPLPAPDGGMGLR